jgi:hypothetical protein
MYHFVSSVVMKRLRQYRSHMFRIQTTVGGGEVAVIFITWHTDVHLASPHPDATKGGNR